MKLKKKVKRTILFIIIIIFIILGIAIYKGFNKQEKVKEVKIVNEIKEYNYKLKENKPKKYKEMFNELKIILSKEDVDEEAYVKKITEMFIYDFYSLNDKVAKTDVGGLDFVYDEIISNFLQNAENTYYKYIESNIYNNRKQSLPVVSNISVEDIEKKEFAYGKENDENAFYVTVSWTYTDENFSDYQKNAILIFIHDNKKLCLVELQ